MNTPAPVLADEHERLLVVDLYAILNTPPEETFDRFTALARQVFGMPIALVSIMGSDRQCFKSHAGTDLDGTAREIAFCAHAIALDAPLVVEDATADPRFVDNPLVTDPPHIRFYAGVPLRSREGRVLGTLCVLDTVPRAFPPEQREILAQMAALVEVELERRRDRIARGGVDHEFHEDPRVILEGISDAFCALDYDLRFQHLNQAAEKLVRQPRERLVGKSIWRIFPELIQTPLFERLTRAGTERIDIEFEQYYDTWNVWLRARILSVEGGLAVFLSEITDQVKKAQALHDSESLKSAILDAAFDCIITIDEQARIVEFNPAAERTFGFTREEVLGRVLTDLIIPHHYRAAHTRGMEHYLKTGEGPVLGRRIEISALRHDNTEFPVELAISPILLENNRRLFTAYLRDISQRKEAELALRQSLEKERKLGEMKSRFVAQASHEFRTPLAMIRSSAQLIRRVYADEPEKTIKYIERIESGVTGMIQLLEDLLLLSESQTTEWPVRPEPLQLDVFITSLVEELALAHGHTEPIPLRGNLKGMTVPMDHKLLRLILNNLISNALKYSRTPASPIDLHGYVDQDVLTVCVADQGIGVPEHELAHVFEAFHRAGNVGSRQGTGLGLAIARGAVERLGGTINVASMEGQGTTVTFTIPLATARETAALPV